MRTMIYRCPAWMYGLLIAGAIAPLGILPLVEALSWPPFTKLIIIGVGCAVVFYAIFLLPTRLVVSEEGVCEKRLFSELRLSWGEIVEWQFVSHWWYPDFWIRDRAGKTHQLKRWLVFGKVRSSQVAEIMRQRGIVGREVCDA